MDTSKLGQRFNEGKSRHDLIEPFAINELAKVYTKGANKYADRNWEKGMNWSKMIASLKRHINQFENGEDIDFDPKCESCQKGTCTSHTGLYHIAHAAWNCLGLLSYYKIFPQGDDRQHPYLRQPKIGLDIDEVLCDWVAGWAKHWGIPVPKNWFFDRDLMQKFEEMKADGSINDFYLSLSAKTKPDDIPFEPHCYITSRPVPTEITEKWLDMNGFSSRPVYTVPTGKSKLDVIKESGLEIFVDDCFSNFKELNQNGICTYLFDAPHNQRYNVGYKRIFSLKDLMIL